jgi:uncharacterized protein YbaR (Trm112 family)
MARAILSQSLLNILVCPVCHQAVTAGPDDALHAWLHCTRCGLYYPVLDGIPVMIEQRAMPQPPFA